MVAEIKRAVFRALTRLRAATIKEFGMIAQLATQAPDGYDEDIASAPKLKELKEESIAKKVHMMDNAIKLLVKQIVKNNEKMKTTEEYQETGSMPKDFYKKQAYGKLLSVSPSLLKGFYEKPALLQKKANESPKAAHVVPGTHYAKADSSEPPPGVLVQFAAYKQFCNVTTPDKQNSTANVQEQVGVAIGY